ncbi:G-protein coupled receptor [Biomphalaria pfeifferi]|uniref:G-protein coupled receptor n=1 Tax=Biomphalaria pfeifferi TaxID=112525 RepID=A0AAD8C7U3_BIOPF|nr:G-protein coupled receptor [Biomphalaria pfeifferi]
MTTYTMSITTLGYTSSNSSPPFGFTTKSTTATPTTTTAQAYYVCWSKADSLEQLLLFQTIECYINPILSFLGLGANIMSLVVLRKCGIHKPSNILLFGLVIADCMCLLMTMDYSLPILYFGPNKLYPVNCGFQYHDVINYFLVITALICTFFGFLGRFVNPFIQMCISVERLFAIFAPMTFKKLITGKRAFVCILLCFSIWLPWAVFKMFIYDVYKQKISRGVNYMIITSNTFYRNNKYIIDRIDLLVVDTLVSWIPLALVTSATLTILVKVKMVLRNRMRLTSSASKVTWSRRTTRTLLATSVVFILTHACGSFIIYFSPCCGDVQTYLRNATYFLVYTINASSNLLIFLICNDKFFKIFINLLYPQK